MYSKNLIDFSGDSPVVVDSGQAREANEESSDLLECNQTSLNEF